MGYMADEYMSGAIIPDDMPLDLMGNPDVQRLLNNVYSALEHFDGFIDPNSEGYEEVLYINKRDGAVAVVEKYQSMLEDALYRQRLFGEQFNLEGFIETLSSIKIEEVIND